MLLKIPFTITFKFTWYPRKKIQKIVFNTFIEENDKIKQDKNILLMHIQAQYQGHVL